jgi:uncharacterized membrane protein YjjP (DUF1212 family)
MSETSSFSRSIVVRQTLGKVIKGYKATLMIFMLGLATSVLWYRFGGPEWLDVLASAFAGGIGTVLGFWVRTAQARRREEESS